MKERAKELRRNMTPASNRMWYYLRDRRLGGYKFVREKVIGNYIVDFLCFQKKLIIEVDGGQHMDAVHYDMKRTEYLEGLGYQVIRVWNNEVFENLVGVMEGVLDRLEALPSPPTPLPGGEGSQL